jgi:hypothetical protein
VQAEARRFLNRLGQSNQQVPAAVYRQIEHNLFAAGVRFAGLSRRGPLDEEPH